MEPLIQSFTKTLAPCSGCGNNGVDYFIEQKAKGEKMTFILQVEATGDDLIKAISGDRSAWNVISGNPARQQPVGQATGTFQQTTTTSVPTIKPV